MPRKAQTALLPRTTCPHCWHTFEPHDVLWISVHAALRGDLRLGPEQQARFLPSRFTPRGTALDQRGQECRELACPSCHLVVPRAFLEIAPWFVSILGTPACGKSFYLAAMIWEMRQTLPRMFNLSFSDTDASFNTILNDYEQQLFQNSTPDKPISLSALIRKTEEQGEQYSMVIDGERTISYPRPILFTVRPPQEARLSEPSRIRARILSVYDNAGESFLAGKDSATNPVTRHLAQSSVLLYLFDPTQHAQFREQLGNKELLSGSTMKLNRQDLVLVEAATRVRRYANLGDNMKHDRPLFVIVTKRDLWMNLLPESQSGPAFVQTQSGTHALNLSRVEEESQAIRKLLRQTCPEVVNAAEEFASNVQYFGVSALGTAPVRMPDSGLWGIRPVDLKPLNVAVPILYGLHTRLPGIIPVAKRQSKSVAGKVG